MMKYVIKVRRHPREPWSAWTATSNKVIAIQNILTVRRIGWEFICEREKL